MENIDLRRFNQANFFNQTKSNYKDRIKFWARNVKSAVDSKADEMIHQLSNDPSYSYVAGKSHQFSDNTCDEILTFSLFKLPTLKIFNQDGTEYIRQSRETLSKEKQAQSSDRKLLGDITNRKILHRLTKTPKSKLVNTKKLKSVVHQIDRFSLPCISEVPQAVFWQHKSNQENNKITKNNFEQSNLINSHKDVDNAKYIFVDSHYLRTEPLELSSNNNNYNENQDKENPPKSYEQIFVNNKIDYNYKIPKISDKNDECVRFCFDQEDLDLLGAEYSVDENSNTKESPYNTFTTDQLGAV